MIRTKGRLCLCTALLTMNLVFIWGNSLLPREASAAFSNWVGNVLSFILPGGGEQELGGGGDLLRKVAHCAEFACLGMCLRWLFGMLLKKPASWFTMPFFAGVLVAFLDEGIQMLVPGRGPGLVDVGIDTTGLVLGIGFLSIIYVYRKNKMLEENKP